MTLRHLTEQLQALTRAGYPVEALLAVANHWRGFLRALEVVSPPRVGDALDVASSAEGEARVRALETVRATAQSVEELLAGAHPAFRDGRTRLDDAARFWGIASPPKNPGKALSMLSYLTDDALYDALDEGVRALTAALDAVAAEGEKALPRFLEAARDQPDAIDAQREVVDAGLDFRLAGTRLYLRANGFLRRVQELLRRSAHPAYRQAAERPLPWASDAELAGEL